MRDRSSAAETVVGSLTRQRDEARARLERLQRISKEQPALLTECQNIERDYRMIRRGYNEVLGRLQSANIWLIPDTPPRNAPVDEVKTQILDPPEVSPMPIPPMRPIMIVCVFLATPIVGFAISGLSPARSRHV